jgi:hypothetical protein
VVRAIATTDQEGIGFRIGCELGLGYDFRAGYVIAGETGYISNCPYGDDYHSMGRISGHGPDDWRQDGPGYGSAKECAEREANAEVFFGAVIFFGGYDGYWSTMSVEDASEKPRAVKIVERHVFSVV